MARWRNRRRSLLRPAGFDELGLRRAFSDRLLPFLVAAMAFLAALALAGAEGAASLARHWREGAGTSLTVQVPRAGAPGSFRRGGDQARGGACGAARHTGDHRGAAAQRRRAGGAAAAVAGQRYRAAVAAAAGGDPGSSRRIRQQPRRPGAEAGGGSAGHDGGEPRRVDPPADRAGPQPAGLRGCGAAGGGGGGRGGDRGGDPRRPRRAPRLDRDRTWAGCDRRLHRGAVRLARHRARRPGWLPRRAGGGPRCWWCWPSWRRRSPARKRAAQRHQGEPWRMAR